MIHADFNNDIQLAEAFRKGEPAALNILWKNHYKALVYFADQLVRNNLLSEDIVSETFVKVWNMRDRFDNVHSIKAFLYVTVRNTCYDHLRSQEIHARIHKEILYTADSYATEMNRDDYDMMYAEYIQQLYEQVKNLPERCQEVFKLYFFNRNTTREIADLLNISEQTVRNQKTKAIHMLRSVLLKKDMLPACVLPLVALLFAVED
jgi:RNA polymerase sigma-70 factor (ECF subfamily)